MKSVLFDMWICHRIAPLFWRPTVWDYVIRDDFRLVVAAALRTGLGWTWKGFKNVGSDKPREATVDWLWKVYWNVRGCGIRVSWAGRKAASVMYLGAFNLTGAVKTMRDAVGVA